MVSISQCAPGGVVYRVQNVLNEMTKKDGSQEHAEDDNHHEIGNSSRFTTKGMLPVAISSPICTARWSSKCADGMPYSHLTRAAQHRLGVVGSHRDHFLLTVGVVVS